MTQGKPWRMLLGAGFLLLIIGVALVALSVFRYQRAAWHEFSESCHAQVTTFEEYVEYWIVRDQLGSIPAAARLLLLGNGLYADVILPDHTVLSERDENLDPSLVPGEINLDDLTSHSNHDEIRNGVLEITVPISLSGHADSVIGVIRLGFSGEYVGALIRHRALIASSIGAGIWLVLMAGVSGALWLGQRKESPESSEDGILRCGQLAIDQRTLEVRLGDVVVELTPKLFALLLLFARDPGAVLSDDDIVPVLWPDSPYATAADVKQCVYMLRQRFSDVHANPKRLIANVKGFGYRLDPSALDEDLTQI
ncbi:response regulator transcription factor [Candidatus Bipolaricaulota bacterium]|nr:response regulator transcription factor [Candidatus Bipolaricaulota bacterium]